MTEWASSAEHEQVSRYLSAEEIELWRAVTATVRPRDPRKLAAARPQAEQKPVPKAEHRVLVETPVKMKPVLRPLGLIDRRQQRELSKGRLEIDARIDLHGRRVADAHQAVNEFLQRAQGEGARVVLIVTGKGGARPGVGAAYSDGEIGILRRQAPLWLADPRLRHVVAAFGEAAPAHGGAGALYVRLRRR
ncbi:MAG: Smr/MutS family protein [Rhodoblastus sp.]|nr:Smr/MutS family protein [Rhodoblastus sp.]